MTLFILSVLIITGALLICTVQMSLTYRRAKSSDQVLLRLPLLHAFSVSTPIPNGDPYRF